MTTVAKMLVDAGADVNSKDFEVCMARMHLYCMSSTANVNKCCVMPLAATVTHVFMLLCSNFCFGQRSQTGAAQVQKV